MPLHQKKILYSGAVSLYLPAFWSFSLSFELLGCCCCCCCCFCCCHPLEVRWGILQDVAPSGFIEYFPNDCNQAVHFWQPYHKSLVVFELAKQHVFTPQKNCTNDIEDYYTCVFIRVNKHLETFLRQVIVSLLGLFIKVKCCLILGRRALHRVCTHLCLSACGSQRPTLDVFLYCSSPYFLRQGLIEPGANQLSQSG